MVRESAQTANEASSMNNSDITHDINLYRSFDWHKDDVKTRNRVEYYASRIAWGRMIAQDWSDAEGFIRHTLWTGNY